MEKYNKAQVLEEAIKYFNGDQLSAQVWIDKYCLKDSDDNLYELTPNDMHKRISKELHRIECKYKDPMSETEIYNLLKDFKFIVPQGGSMAGIGNNFQLASLSNCFVIGNLSVYDSYGAIMKLDQELIQLMKRRGGVGFDISFLRPKGAPVKNSALTSTGMTPFMERFSNSTKEVAQDGRRGALMQTCSVEHIDIENFIDAKLDKDKVNGANISVKITDKFMNAVLNNDDFEQTYPVNTDNVKYRKQTNAKQIWDKIINNAWMSAEPGVLFWDTIIRESPADCYKSLGFQTTATNPCGEIPLCPYDSCRLMVLNLTGYVENEFTEKAKFNMDLFKKHSGIIMKLMDDVIDIEIEKIDDIINKIKSDPEDPKIKQVELDLWKAVKDKAILGRRSGIGVTGTGDMLAMLNLTYGTKKATDFITNIHKVLAIETYKQSCLLARDRGKFSIYDYKKEIDNPFINRLCEEDLELRQLLKQYGRRNISILTISPTGSVSMMTQTTSGIEPVFQIMYNRKRKVMKDVDVNDKYEIDSEGVKWERFKVFHHKFKNYLNIIGYSNEMIDAMSDEELNNLIIKSPYYKATAHDVDWIEKINMQGLIQKWVDHSISVTCNVPNNISIDIIDEIYKTAWRVGCKGVTVYRDGCREGVLTTDKDVSKNFKNIIQYDAPKRPKMLDCDVINFTNNKEKWIAFVGIFEGYPYEIFTGLTEDFSIPLYVSKGKIRKLKVNGRGKYDFIYLNKDNEEVVVENLNECFNAEYFNYAKLISSLLRHKMPMDYLVNVVQNLKFDSDLITTWKAGVARILKKYIPNGTIVRIKDNNNCGVCGSNQFIYENGCKRCAECGQPGDC